MSKPSPGDNRATHDNKFRLLRKLTTPQSLFESLKSDSSPYTVEPNIVLRTMHYVPVSTNKKVNQ